MPEINQSAIKGEPGTGYVGPTSGPVVSDDYTQNPTKYLDDLYAAAKQGGPQAA